MKPAGPGPSRGLAAGSGPAPGFGRAHRPSLAGLGQVGDPQLAGTGHPARRRDPPTGNASDPGEEFLRRTEAHIRYEVGGVEYQWGGDAQARENIMGVVVLIAAGVPSTIRAPGRRPSP